MWQRLSLLAKDLIQAGKVVLTEFGFPKRLVSDAGMNFVSQQFKDFCRCLNIDQIVTSSYHHQNNGQVKACFRFVKCTIKKCRQTNNDVHFTLLQITSTPTSAWLPSPAMMLLKRPIRALLPQIDREPINVNNDDEYYEALKSGKEAYTTNNEYLQRLYVIFFRIYSSSPDGGWVPWHMVQLLKATAETTGGDHIEWEWQRRTE